MRAAAQALDDCAMETLLALAALSFGDERHDVADLVLVGLLTGEWQALEDLVGRGVGLEAAWAGRVDAEELERALAAFRYERRLIAAADLRGWLSERSLRLADLDGYCGGSCCAPVVRVSPARRRPPRGSRR